MSELKATTVYDAYWKANSVGEGTGIQVYLKSEADKVIAEKDKELRHHKYKRCLDMARWCEAEAQKFLTQQGALIGFPWTDRFQYLQWQITHYSRWHRIWLKLAKKFKEAK